MFLRIFIGCLGAFSLAPSLYAAAGADIAKALQAQYLDVRSDCGTPSKPAFLCSGVMLRGTFPSDDYDSWNPSPNSVKNGGVSFSYLRKDVKFGSLAYSYANGLIFYPILNTPAELKDDIEVLCYFPKDADSLNRNHQGCGRNTRYPLDSQPCDEHWPEIDSANEWVAHYEKPGISYRNAHQCGFNVRDDENDKSGPRFYTGIAARLLLQQHTGYISEQNEINLATWAQNLHSQVPIQAFFYLASAEKEGAARPEDDPDWQGRPYSTNIAVGLEGAQHDQRVMYQRSGRVIPVIRLDLPQSDSGEASFTYREADQVISDH